MRVADLIARSLEAQGVERAYCVPGESYLALLDALHDSDIKIIICRHEGGAGFMAVNEAKITGIPGVLMVSRGPGATNAAIAIHVAEQDATPMIVLIGQVSREELTRGAFQEMDYRLVFGSVAKAVFEVTEAAKIGETVARAFHIANSGVKGPVIISLPEDVLSDQTNMPVVEPFPLTQVSHSLPQADQLQAAIDTAERPLVLAGGLLRGERGAAALSRFAEAQRIPVAATWKNQDVFDNSSPLYAGHLGFGTPKPHQDMLRQADLIVAVGTRLGDLASLNYTLPRAPQPEQRLVHIYPDSQPIGRVFRTDLGLVADPIGLLQELGQRPRVVSSARETWISSVNGFVRKLISFTPSPPEDGIDFGEVVTAIAAIAPANAVITTDSGNASSWAHRYWAMTPRNLLLGIIGGAMGNGVPAAVTASLIMPERMAICFVGDGGMLMTGQELATAIQYGAAPKIIISDNGSYGTIRTHQERHFPARVSGTGLHNPDFAAWAQSFGAKAFSIGKGDDVRGVIADALVHDGATVVHVKSSLERISAFTTLSALKPANQTETG
jgi:acetolactate synthase-1/2/3 large subunit